MRPGLSGFLGRGLCVYNVFARPGLIFIRPGIPDFLGRGLCVYNVFALSSIVADRGFQESAFLKVHFFLLLIHAV